MLGNPAETEKFAIKFANWIGDNYIYTIRKIWVENIEEHLNPKEFTTEELYSEFIKETIF